MEKGGEGHVCMEDGKMVFDFEETASSATQKENTTPEKVE